MLLAVMATFTLSSSVLTNWKIHYVTAGGNFYEKLHPATYFTLLAFSLLLIRSRGPVGELNRMFSESKLLLAYLLCWLFLLIQVIVLERPFTVIIDTFLLPILIAMVMWQLSQAQKRPLAWAIHFTILLNIVLGYYEYFSGHRLIPLTLGDVVVMGEWRSAALLGHPLTASGVVGAYVLALVLRPAICPPLLVRLPLIAFSLGSLMAFGGRTSLVTVLAMIGLIGLFEAVRLMRGKRMPLPAAILAICVLFAAGAIIFAALNLGIFDKMLLRFSSDKGSALARFATFNLLSHFDWHELILGPNPVRVNALQAQLGLNYGIENFWISSDRPVRPRPHRPADDRTDLLLRRTAAPLKPRGMGHRGADRHHRRQFGEFFVEEHSARAVRDLHFGPAAAPAAARHRALARPPACQLPVRSGITRESLSYDHLCRQHPSRTSRHRP